jgi:general stress protein YciG
MTQMNSPETAAPSTETSPTPRPKKRGFAAMDPERVRELSRRGGIAAHRAGTAHQFTPEEAREAGRKGGLAAHAKDQKPEESN